MSIKIERLSVLDVVKVTPEIFHDQRGRFLECHRTFDLGEQAVVRGPFVQSNVSTSVAWCMRGLHYQVKDGQGKFVRCLMGRIYDVAVDMREGSPTFGKWCGAMLDDQEMSALWVPPGFAHGFLTVGRPAIVHYECTSYYVEEYNRTLLWNDQDIGITWPLAEMRATAPTMSNKDRAGTPFRNAEKVVGA